MSLPDILLPYQQEWLADEADVKLCEKSRRVGLSWSEAADASLIAAAEDGDDYWYIGYNHDMAQEFINDVGFWSRHFQHAVSQTDEYVLDDEERDGGILTYRVRFASGLRVNALSSRPTNLRGKQGVVCIDEAAFVDSIEQLIKAAMALLMWGGKVRIISTHNGEDNPFNELVLDSRAGKRPYSLHRIDFQQAVEQGLYRRICLAKGDEWTEAGEEQWVQSIYTFYGDDAAEELDCIPSSGMGVYLTRAMIEAVMDRDIPVVRWAQPDEFTYLPKHIREAETRDWCESKLSPLLAELDPMLRHYYGSDFARSGDLSDLWPVAERRDLILSTPFVVELRNIPFEQQRQILFYIVKRLPRFSGGAHDARGNGQYLAEVAAQEFGSNRIAEVMTSTEWYRENMPRFKAAFEDKTINAPYDADILTDLRAVKKDKGIAKVPEGIRVRGSDGLYRHGDAAIALAMVIYAVASIDAPPIEFESTGRRASAALRTGGGLQTSTGFGSVRGGNDFGGFNG